MRIAAFTLIALLLPAASARAALTLTVEAPTFYPGQSGFVEVFFTETAPAENERLVAYSVGLELVGPPGITFGPAPLLREPTRHPFVFAPGTPIDDTGSGPTRIRSLVALPTGSADITDNAGVLRVPITIAPDATFGQRGIVFNLMGA